MKLFRKYQNPSFIVRFQSWYCIMSKSKCPSAESDCIQDWNKKGKPCQYYFNQGLEMAIPWTRKMDMLGESS